MNIVVSWITLFLFLAALIIYWAWRPQAVLRDSLEKEDRIDWFKLILLSYVTAVILSWILYGFREKKIQDLIETTVANVRNEVAQVRQEIQAVVAGIESKVGSVEEKIQSVVGSIEKKVGKGIKTVVSDVKALEEGAKTLLQSDLAQSVLKNLVK